MSVPTCANDLPLEAIASHDASATGEPFVYPHTTSLTETEQPCVAV